MNWTSDTELSKDERFIASKLLSIIIEHWLKSPEEKKRLRRNRNSRERYQAMRDLGLKRTPYGWE